MLKLQEVFKINPLYEADGYKIGHKDMLASNTTREYWTWIPRSVKYMHPSITEVMSAGQQIVIRYLHSTFQEFFFNKSIDEAERFARDMSKYLMIDYNGEHFYQLHKLGYLPIKIQALPEGIFTKPNVPHMAGINTLDGYAWLGLFLETMISKTAWQTSTAATISNRFKKNAVEWVKKTDENNLWLADFMCHDFHSRGGNPFTSIAVGLGHAMSNSGSDTLNVIPASRYYYDFDENEVPIYSVNASEHSVTCTGIFYYQDLLKQGKLDKEIEWYYSFDLPCDGSIENPDYLAIAECLNLRDWLKKFPKGILSIVSDTFDLWKLITYILTRLKAEIMARDGKLVIRPDSGDPVDIICGKKILYEDGSNFNQVKGVIELLWDIFGGTVNDQGYKVLDPHIGAIYGDSITLERQLQIYERLAAKQFAATNIVVGVGSYTYVMLTRDTAGWAIKGAWFETKEYYLATPESLEWSDITKEFNIYKDPATDSDKVKKSLKGFQFVNDNFKVESEVSEEKAFSPENQLRVIYEDGKFYNQTTLSEIRERINKN